MHACILTSLHSDSETVCSMYSSPSTSVSHFFALELEKGLRKGRIQVEFACHPLFDDWWHVSGL